MINLTVDTGSDTTKLYSFDQSVVTIGTATVPSVDVPITGKGLYEKHIQIILENSQFYAINFANDPFATLNGKPFGKKKLHNQDIIRLSNTSIQIELEKNALALELDLQHFPSEAATDLQKNSAGEEQITDKFDIDIEALLNQVEQLAEIDEIKKHSLAQAFLEPLPTEDQPLPITVPPADENFYQQTSTPAPLSQTSTPESLMEELTQDSLTEELTPDSLMEALTPDPLTKTHTPDPLIQKPSLKDYYLSEYDDIGEEQNIFETPPNQQSKNQDQPITERNWQIYIKIFSSLLGIFAICSGVAYLWISDQSDKEEISAAKGIADVAMALTYAQLKEIQPQNHNWSDPEFIKNNLTAVLAPSYPSLANFDNHGHFSNCPYLLRIYTSGDLTQFWVIAQPAPSLLQWLIPKSTIILDSRAMEMRKIKDLKSLNRLLLNANTLDSTSGAEVSNLIHQGGLITLASLVSKNENLGLTAPKALALIRPGAENFVYNAPRYYPLGEELMKKAQGLIEKPASSHEVTMLQQEISALSKFPNALFYSSGGIQNAIQDQKALTTLSPKEKFLVAYLQFNTQGQVSNSHLLMDDAPADIALADSGRGGRGGQFLLPVTNEVDNKTIHQGFGGNSEDSKSLVTGSQVNVDEDNPLFLQLAALNVFRQQALRAINDEMITLLNKETQCAQPAFYPRFLQLLTKYIEVAKEQQAKILKKLEAIYKENNHLPALEFLSFAKVSGLQEFLREYLASLKQQMRSPEVTQEQIEKKLQKLEKATNWHELEQQLAETVEVLNLDRIPNEENIVAYQNATRSRVIQKLNQFLLSPDHPLPSQAFDAECKYILIHILKMGWITDPDTYDFYLSEFELRTSLPISQLDDMDGLE